ncbi:MAG: hypothetical protein WAV90_20275 [Gordonia amarae]
MRNQVQRAAFDPIVELGKLLQALGSGSTSSDTGTGSSAWSVAG